MWITTVIPVEGLAQGGQTGPVSRLQEARTAAVPPGFPRTRPTSHQWVTPNVTYSCPQTIPLQESSQTQRDSGITKVGGREDGAGTKGTSWYQRTCPLGLTLQMRIRSLARSLSQFTGKVWQTMESGSTGDLKVFDELLEVGKTV